jgi:hypothetical protein
MADWLPSSGSLNYTQKYRSWRQNIENPYGGVPVLTAWIEIIRIYNDGTLQHNPVGFVIIPMSELIGNDLTLAYNMQNALTTIIGKKVVATYGPATPSFSPLAGTYKDSQLVTISSPYNATIYYTLDGSTPTLNSPVYTNPIEVSSTQTIKAIAFLYGIISPVGFATYTILPIPIFSSPPGTYVGPQEISISIQPLLNSSIYYTLDGSLPTNNSTLYEGPITISQNTTINAIAFWNGTSSTISTITYIILPFTPTFSLPGGNYEGPQTLTLSGEGIIYYTLDNSDPTNGSILYEGPITISSSGTVKAVAILNGESSSVGSEIYVIS